VNEPQNRKKIKPRLIHISHLNLMIFFKQRIETEKIKHEMSLFFYSFHLGIWHALDLQLLQRVDNLEKKVNKTDELT